MKYEILGAVWYTPPAPGLDAATHALLGLHSLSVGFVAIKTSEGKWKCYCGLGLGESQEADALAIAATGVKVSKEVAAAHFPNLEAKEFIL